MHTIIKRYLRRKKLIQMMDDGVAMPLGITDDDVGCDSRIFRGGAMSFKLRNTSFDMDIDFTDHFGTMKSARRVQRSSQTYWILEFIRRMDRGRNFEVVVLGCRNPARKQYAVYIYELGLEWTYSSPVGNLTSGTRFVVQATNVLPHNGQMTLVRVQV